MMTKGVILAGGTGSRLMPLTRVTNKHLLPVGELPMILHSIKKMVNFGIMDIMIVTGTEHMGDMISLIGSGGSYRCDCTYKIQDKPDGIAGALSLCERFVGDDSFVVILGDNIFQAGLDDIVNKFLKTKNARGYLPSCALALKKVEDPARFGVAEVEGDTIIGIEEKPEHPKSDLCTTGIYVYDHHVFEIIRGLKKSARGEYEITDVNNQYISSGGATFVELRGWWTDAGTHDSYYHANMKIRE